MFEGDCNTLPEDSVPDLRGVVDRLNSFDRFLGHSSKDLDDILLAKHNQSSLLDFNESCMLTINKSNAASHLPVKHDGILEKILAKPVTPVVSTDKKETSSSSRSATSSRPSTKLRGFDYGNGKDEKNSLFAIGEEPEEKKSQRERSGRHSSSGDRKEPVSRKSTSPHPPPRSQRKGKDEGMNESDKTKALRTGQETEDLPKVLSSPISPKYQQQPQQHRREKVDPLSRSLHSEASSKRHSRHVLYSSMSRRADQSDRRMTKHNDPLASRSEHIPRSKVKETLERKSSSSSVTLSTSLHEEESGDNRGQSRSPSCPRPRHARRTTRTNNPPTDVNPPSRDNELDEKKRESHRSPRTSRKPSSEILRSRSIPRLSSQSRRSKKPSSSTNLYTDGERPLSRRSVSSDNIVDDTATTNGDNRSSTSRRRLKSRCSQGDNVERSRNENSKQRDSIQSFFGTRGGSGIITNTPATQLKHRVSAGDLSSHASLHNAPPASNETKTSIITPTTINHLMLDLRRQTSRNVMQKFKSTRNLQSGIMDDILT